MKTIKAGEVIYAKTNAELLNGLLGKHYKAWMKADYPLDIDEMLWMPRLDGVVRAGWRNMMQNGQIVEEYVGGHPYPSNIYVGLNIKRRAVFEKCDRAFVSGVYSLLNAGGYFIFRGVFELDSDSTLTHRILRPIKDEISL